MKRAVSYSDSFLVLGGDRERDFDGALTPILIPRVQSGGNLQATPPNPEYKPSRSRKVLCFLFTFKGSFHLLLISAFETLFYFLYVNKSENQGILTAINTYYQPLVQDCQTTWTNSTRNLAQDLLLLFNQTQIDAAGTAESAARAAYNQKLLNYSILYSGICAVLCAGATVYVKWQRWKIPWVRMISENFSFVLILGLYELFFFKTIIYNYDTLGKAELNQYLIDGLSQCAATP
jgi:hypothetical protein